MKLAIAKVIITQALGLLGNLAKYLFNSIRFWNIKRRARKAESDFFSEKTKTHLLIKKAESKMKLKKNLEAIKHPSRNLQEYIERDKKQ